MLTFSAAAGFAALRLLAMIMALAPQVVAVPMASVTQGAATPVSSSAPASYSNSTQSSSIYWLSSIQRQGLVPFGNSTSHKVYRSVKDYGAKGKSTTFFLLILVDSLLRRWLHRRHGRYQQGRDGW